MKGAADDDFYLIEYNVDTIREGGFISLRKTNKYRYFQRYDKHLLNILHSL